MSVFVGGILLLVGLVFIGLALPSGRAVRRWERTGGRLLGASRSRLADGGDQMWNIAVSWRDHAGQEHAGTFPRSVRPRRTHRRPRRGLVRPPPAGPRPYAPA